MINNDDSSYREMMRAIEDFDNDLREEAEVMKLLKAIQTRKEADNKNAIVFARQYYTSEKIGELNQNAIERHLETEESGTYFSNDFPDIAKVKMIVEREKELNYINDRLDNPPTFLTSLTDFFLKGDKND